MSAASLRELITAKIDGSSEAVRQDVVTHFVDIELKRRTKLIIDGMTKLSSAEAELAKIKADFMVFGDDGKPIQQGWTTQQKGKRDKAQKLVDRVNAALTPAIVEGNFKLLEDLAKEGGGGKSQDQSDDDK